jgi:hypothetical protein
LGQPHGCARLGRFGDTRSTASVVRVWSTVAALAVAHNAILSAASEPPVLLVAQVADVQRGHVGQPRHQRQRRQSPQQPPRGPVTLRRSVI